ncbi:ABC transporter permease [Phytohabitans kaempferiae]|uniref:ABC transporter permease n=1 Tax=Phytohabitans kaempferiae TaxID=1620943 RepID=A0ABV6M537_9ACTN
MSRRLLSWAESAVLPVVVTVLVVFLAAPLVVLVATAFTTTPYLTFPPDGLTFRWFEGVLTDPSWRAAGWNSLIIAAMSVGVAAVVGAPAAIILARRGVRFASSLTLLIMIPIMVPSIMYVLGLMLGYNELNISVPTWGIVLALAVLITPYLVRTLMAALEQLDPALEEAALSLGASRLRIWVEILLPNVAKSFFSGISLAFILAFDELVVPLFLAGPDVPTLPVRIYSSVAYNVDPSVAAVSSLLVLVSALVAVLSARDNLRKPATRKDGAPNGGA